MSLLFGTLAAAESFLYISKLSKPAATRIAKYTMYVTSSQSLAESPAGMKWDQL